MLHRLEQTYIRTAPSRLLYISGYAMPNTTFLTWRMAALQVVTHRVSQVANKWRTERLPLPTDLLSVMHNVSAINALYGNYI